VVDNQSGEAADPKRRAALIAKVDRLTAQIFWARLGIILFVAVVGLSVAAWVAPRTVLVLVYVTVFVFVIEALASVVRTTLESNRKH
jgi:hypothetical protein